MLASHKIFNQFPSEFMLSEWMCEVAVGMLDCLYALYDNVESELIEF